MQRLPAVFPGVLDRGACAVSMTFVLVMGAQFARTMAWKAHGKNHDDLMSQLKRKFIFNSVKRLQGP